MITAEQQYNRDRAAIALKNGITRARKHVQADHLEVAIRAMKSAAGTAETWLDGTNPNAK